MSHHELIVFDWDGTLMDSTHVIAASLREACADVGVAVPSEADARYVIGLGLEDTFNHVAPALDAERGRRLSERYRYHFLAGEGSVPLYDGVVDMLADLHARGRRMAVATGKARRGLERALDATGLRPWFEATRCADEGLAKPHPDMLLMLLEMTGVAPAHAVMVGDTTHDLELAVNAGIDAVAVSYGAHPTALLETRPAMARCASVRELHEWLVQDA